MHQKLELQSIKKCWANFKRRKNFKHEKFSKFKRKIIFSKLKFNKNYLIQKKNKRICGISAPSRSSTLISYVKLDENIIDYILGINGFQNWKIYAWNKNTNFK